MKPDFSIFLTDQKVVQFFADEVVLFLSYLIGGLIVIDSFINQLPSGHKTVACFIGSDSVSSGQQSYINEYCAEFVPSWTYAVPIVTFCHGLLTVLLHYSWYSMVLYADKVYRKQEKTHVKVTVGPSESVQLAIEHLNDAVLTKLRQYNDKVQATVEQSNAAVQDNQMQLYWIK